jgi:hypothetical protein
MSSHRNFAQLYICGGRGPTTVRHSGMGRDPPAGAHTDVGHGVRSGGRSLPPGGSVAPR